MKEKRRMHEANLPGVAIIPGAEPFLLPSGDIGCLLIHGISSTPQQMRLMGEFLASRGITAHGVRLAGHGTRVEDLHETTYEDWIVSAEEGLSRLEERCSSVFCAGLSLGGILSLRLARLYPERVRGVVTICSSYRLRTFLFKLVPLVKGIMKKFPTGSSSINDPDVEEVKYSYHSVPAVYQLMKLNALVREDLPHIGQPALIFGARGDKVIDPEDPARYYDRIASSEKELIWLDKSDHVAVLDYDKELVFEKTAAFINKHSAVPTVDRP